MKTPHTVQKKYSHFLLIFFCTILLIPVFIATNLAPKLKKAPTKRALIIAIGDYPEYEDPEMSWKPLSSHNDIAPIRHALLSKGFQKKHILLLKDEEATKENIHHAIAHKLVEMSNKGDYIVIHFSGHGQQMADDNGDEADGLDEAIIPYDAKKKYQAKAYQGENHLRDDELKEVLGKLRKKLGKNGQVLLLLDACHSGTGLRKEATAKVRGTSEVFSPPSFQIDTTKKETEIEIFDDRSDWAKVIGFYAAAPYQSNSECSNDERQAMGSLSYAFSKALVKTREGDSYETLFARIQSIMALKVPRQTPQAEGALKVAVFGGQVEDPLTYFRSVKWYGNDSLKINGGLLHGLTEESTVLFYPNTVKDPQKTAHLASGIVKRSYMGYAIVAILAGELKEEDKATCKIILEKRQYAYTLKVSLAKSLDNSSKKYLQAQIDSSKAFQLQPENTDLLVHTNKQLELLTPDGTVVATAPTTQTLWPILKKYYVANFLRNLDCETPSLKAKLEIISCDTCKIRYENGQYIAKNDQNLRCRITNQGTERIYYTVIGIDYKQEITALVPLCVIGDCYNNGTPAGAYLDAKKATNCLGGFKVDAPFSANVLKLVTSRQPIDLRYVVTRGKRGSPTAQSPFEFLYRELVEGERMRGEDAFSLPSGKVHVETVLVRTGL